ncbi:MAG: hypothetical protein GXO48_02445 [Chlorobi bacterium]|nr:hypothetical protein [Chlorobiota bacterium]
MGRDKIDQVKMRSKSVVRYRSNFVISTLILLAGSLTLHSQNVGVGTISPQARLHVIAPSGFTSPLLRVEVNGSANPYLIIQPDGRVGIGVSSPSEVLDISGNVRFSGALMPGGDAGSSGQVLVSQGPGIAPQWQDATSVGGDNWGSQVAQTQAPIIGDGTATSPITLQSGASTGDILIWDGSQWQISSSPFVRTCSGVMTNYVQKWTGTDLCNSTIYDDGVRVGIGTASPHPDAILELNSSDKGFLPPRVALVSADLPNPLSSPAPGMLVYNTNTSGTGHNVVSPGYYYWDGARWRRIQTNAYAGAIFGVHHNNTSYKLTAIASQWECTGAYIDLPPGKWVVFITELIRFTYGTSGSAPCPLWVRTTLGDGSCTQGTITTTNPASGDIVGSSLASGSMPTDHIYDFVTGQIVIDNTTTSTKRYSLWAQYRPQSSSCPTFSSSDGLLNFGGIQGENQIIALPAE